MEKRPILGSPEVSFRYQKDPTFQILVDAGIGTELSSSGYCWAACLDMALSPFVAEDAARQQIINDSVRHQRLMRDAFTPNGELHGDKLEDMIAVVNENLSTRNLAPRLRLIDGIAFDNFHQELQKGRVVIFGIKNDEGGHTMIMDKLYVDGGKYIYAIYDPAIENPIEARSYLDNFQLYGRHMYTDTKLHNFIISVGVE